MKKQLSKSEIKSLNEELLQQFKLTDFFSRKDRIEIAESDHTLFILHDSKPLFFYFEGKLIPMLRLLLERATLLKQVVVDMGAVKFVTSGADVMRPGIVDLDHSIKKDELIVIVDETHKKPLAVGKALFSGEDIFRMDKGKVILILHYVGDKYWNAVL